jgi:hypothetical protein
MLALQQSSEAADALMRFRKNSETGVTARRGDAFRWVAPAVPIVVLYVRFNLKRAA